MLLFRVFAICALVLAPFLRAQGPSPRVGGELLVGNGFASFGKHGGSAFGANLDVPWNSWSVRFSAETVHEFAPVLGDRLRTPLERYNHLGIAFGRALTLERVLRIGAGLGAGYLGGMRRAELVSEEEGCADDPMFSDCPQKDRITIRHHRPRGFSTVSLDPYLEAGVQFGRAFGMGVQGQAYVNGEQGLGTIRLYFRIRG